MSRILPITIFLQAIPCPLMLVEAPTGVIYETQAGGHSCNIERAEGYLVPLDFAPDGVIERLCRRWVNVGRGDCVTEGWPGTLSLEGLCIWLPTAEADLDMFRLEFDVERIAAAQEAWLPVKAGSYIGWLIWENSD